MPGSRQNPFCSYIKDPSIRSYHGPHNGRFRKLAPETTSPEPSASLVHDTFKALILNNHYPCVAARSALHHDSYRVGFYPPLASDKATPALASDLWEFVAEFPLRRDRFVTFVASFDGPVTTTDEEFEPLLWSQLQQLHDLDSHHHTWAASVSADPDDPRFSFSFAQRSFFVVGLHPAASRRARRFTWPTLVFNAHTQFEFLREAGEMPRMQTAIRNRDRRLQGDVNPVLADHGEASEAAQYAGRHVEPEWRCPLQVHHHAVDRTSSGASPRSWGDHR